eukprot:TRINITY_DN17676_c0_g1_i1.p1 TRINITY_DN17676_c0_g1~~TRINITY_DN17676_c0_g1_i1.p1  ORF type:complete len:252 (+),score=37.14 TRINITY_DN17676_c0_g1_i1:326-1081(+)
MCADGLAQLRIILQAGPTASCSGLLVTSPRAVEALATLGTLPEIWLRECRVFAVGPQTARAVAGLGFLRVSAVESGGAAALAARIISERDSTHTSAAALLFLAGDKRRRDLPDALAAAGIKLTEITVYKTIPGVCASEVRHTSPRSRFSSEARPAVIFFSPSGVEAVEAAPSLALETIAQTLEAVFRESNQPLPAADSRCRWSSGWGEFAVIAIGKTTAAALEGSQLFGRVDAVAATPTPSGVVAALRLLP